MIRKYQFAKVGSISEGTMRPQDLIDTFCYELRYLGHRSKDLTAIEKRFDRAINSDLGESDEYFTSENSSFDLESLFDMLNEHAPDYMHFGSHPGDGADYGFWVDIDELESNFDGLKVNDLSEVGKKYNGLVLEVNDHGNMTLYRKNRLGFKEIWGVV